jgi:hypothetical protein
MVHKSLGAQLLVVTELVVLTEVDLKTLHLTSKVVVVEEQVIFVEAAQEYTYLVEEEAAAPKEEVVQLVEMEETAVD